MIWNLFKIAASDHTQREAAANPKREFVDTLAFILTLAIIAPIAINALQSPFGADASPFLIAGTSMYPTLTDGQMVLVSPSTQSYSNGDVVVAKLPEAGLQYTTDQTAQYIVKRIIAGPGQTIDIGYDDVIRINGEAIDEPYLTETAKGETYVQNHPTHFELAEGQYFVIGDNRGHSCDSRYFGAVAQEEITGVVNRKTMDPSYLTTFTVKCVIGIVAAYLLTVKILTVSLRRLFKA